MFEAPSNRRLVLPQEKQTMLNINAVTRFCRLAFVGPFALMFFAGTPAATAAEAPVSAIADDADAQRAPVREGTCGEWDLGPDGDFELDIDVDVEAEAYCLARCKGFESYYYVSSDTVLISDEGEWACRRAGKLFCDQNFDRRLADSCLGQ